MLRELRPPRTSGFEVRFETPPGEQAQVDFARFDVEFRDEPGVKRIVWLFSMALGHSRFIWARFVPHQDLQSVLRCHMAAFEALGGVSREILYDRMKTAVIGEDRDMVSSSTIAPFSIWRAITASNRALAGPIAPKRRARWSGRSAMSGRIFSSAAPFAISMI